jgi:hypothetical protein
MGETMLIMVGIGLWLGYYLGRWRAENRRARYDMDRTWDGRRGYRD